MGDMKHGFLNCRDHLFRTGENMITFSGQVIENIYYDHPLNKGDSATFDCYGIIIFMGLQNTAGSRAANRPHPCQPYL